MKKLLFCLSLFATTLAFAQNDDCSGATALTVGTDFTSGVVTSTNVGATTDTQTSCNDEAADNVWFSVTVPASGNLKIETRELSGSLFDDSILTVYSGTCGSLSEIDCNDDGGDGAFSLLSLTGQTPGATLYVSISKYDADIDNGEFQISAYDPLPPANDNCSGAVALTVGSDFTSGAINSTNLGATTDGTEPSCNSDAVDNVWFSVTVPASGNLKIETREFSGSPFDDSSITVYSGTCGSLTEVGCYGDGGFSAVTLTGQTPGATLYVSVWKYASYIDNGEFQISAYEFVPIANDACSGATPLTVGADFDSGAITSTNVDASTDGTEPSCNDDAADNVWFSVTVPASGNLKIETREVSGSLFDDSSITVYSGTCGSLTEVGCNGDGGFSAVSLTGQTPGATLYVSVWKYASYIDNGEFQISAYEFVPVANDNCSGATPLTVGTDFDSGTITATNVDASTDGAAPSCNTDAVDNVWFSVVVPASGNINIETREVNGSEFGDTTLSIYGGSCGSLTEIECDDDGGDGLFSLISLTGQTPGATLYVSVAKYDSGETSGEFQVSAYDNTQLSTHEVADNSKKISIAPNPFTDRITISDVSEVKSLSITDTSGRLVKTIEKPSASLYLGDLKQGMYFITLKMNNGSVKTLKAIKK
ncbi:T9SS type A sorting domain-containing protein [Chryseobacterium kwangjuense]|uniref:T9SS type A sorting domain-containing protein n=1 Tax=Chryseobacterium kwangjuense TaxID=267125 RepID=A0ABW9K3L5_9FLAO